MASRETRRSDFSRYWSGSLRTAGCAKVVAKTPAPTSMAHRTSSDRSASRGRVLTRLPTATLRPRIEARGERSTNADTLDRFAMTAFDDDDSNRENRPEKFHRCGWPRDSLQIRRNPTPRSRPTREFAGPHRWWD